MHDADTGFEEFATETLRLQVAAEKARASLQLVFEEQRPLLRSVIVSDRSRIKSSASLLEKIQRKRTFNPTYSVSDVSDIVGFMFLTLSDGDIAPALSLVANLLLGPHSEFRSGSRKELGEFQIRELSIYRRDGLQNAESAHPYAQLRRTLRNTDGGHEPANIRFIGQARYNLGVIAATVEVLDEGELHRVPVEFQFKSLLTDVFQEIDHRLLYSESRTSGDEVRFDRGRTSEQLVVLQKLLETADEYISRVLQPPKLLAAQPVTIRREADDWERLQAALSEASASPSLKEDIQRLIRSKAALDAADTQQDVSGAYAGLAREYSQLIQELAAEGVTHDRSNEQLLVFLQVEEAVCLMVSGMRDLVFAAVDLLRSLTGREPSYPTPWFRLAQAASRAASEQASTTGWTSEADELFDEAYRAFERSRAAISALPEGDGDRRKIISAAAEEYIRANIDRLQSFTLWRQADLRRSSVGVTTQADLDLVVLAIGIAKAGLTSIASPSQYDRLLNNVVYYMLDALQMEADETLESAGTPSRDEFRAALHELDAHVARFKSQSVYVLHTLLEGYSLLGEDKRAREFAAKILDANAAGADENSSLENTAIAIRRAWQVVRQGIG